MDRIDDLRELLGAHLPASPREAGFVSRMLALLDEGDGAFSRTTYEPGHFTASAFVLSPDRRRLLLILHATFGVWLQPGGHVEPADRSLRDAARREVCEEVGLSALDPIGAGLLDVDIHDIAACPRAPAHLHFDVRFLFAARGTEVRAADDARAARWIDLADPPAWRSDESLMRAVRRIRELGP